MDDPSKKRTPSMRREEMLNLFLQEVSSLEIAGRLGSTARSVLFTVNNSIGNLSESREKETDVETEREIQKTNLLEREAWSAWFRSQKQSESIKIRSSDGDKKSAEKLTKSQIGDVRFLSMIEKCIAKRISLLGLGRRSKAKTSTIQTAIIISDPHWYGNDAHNKSTQRIASSNSDPALPSPLQSGRVWPPLGQNSPGTAGRD